MIIDTKQIITITEANQNFSRATRIADETKYDPGFPQKLHKTQCITSIQNAWESKRAFLFGFLLFHIWGYGTMKLYFRKFSENEVIV